MIARPHIQFSEKFGTIEFIQDFINDWHGKSVLDCHIVEHSIINTQSSTSILFLDHQDWFGKGTVAVTDKAIV